MAKQPSKGSDKKEQSVAKKILEANKESTAEAEIPDEKPEAEVEDKTPLKPGEKFEKQVTVDFWMSNLHGAEIGIYQKERYMAKNRAFSRNLDLMGAVREEGKPDGMFGIDKDNWHSVPERDLATKRLVVKWFNSESVAHLGTIEQLVGSSLAASIASDDELPVFKCVIPNYDFLVDLKKEHTKLPKIGEMFACCLKIVKEDRWMPIIFDEKRATVGSDWDVKIGDGKRVVAKIDEKLLNVGGKFAVTFLDRDLYRFPPFFKTVVLFTMMLKFKKEVMDDIAKLRELVEKGKVKLNLVPQEEKLFWNPRLLRR
ncbi:MAG: hypothetical protein GYA24_01485 [Candidatus Lokiarchaeota archaeon]|nr:hypothetical protein [Candidatus Lokiarchaeota archaeon]